MMLWRGTRVLGGENVFDDREAMMIAHRDDAERLRGKVRVWRAGFWGMAFCYAALFCFAVLL